MLQHCRLALCGLLTLTLATSAATQAQTWTFDETTTGGDIAWSSPTAVPASCGSPTLTVPICRP